MKCDLCGDLGNTQTVLSVYQTEKVKDVCSDCASDLDALKANCRKLSDKTTEKINRRAANVALKARNTNTFWSLVSAGGVAIKEVLRLNKEQV